MSIMSLELGKKIELSSTIGFARSLMPGRFTTDLIPVFFKANAHKSVERRFRVIPPLIIVVPRPPHVLSVEYLKPIERFFGLPTIFTSVYMETIVPRLRKSN